MTEDKRYYEHILNHFRWHFDGNEWVSPDKKHMYKMPYYAINTIAKQIMNKYHTTCFDLLEKRGWEWTSRNKNPNQWRSNWQSPNRAFEFRHIVVATAFSEMMKND